MLATAFSRSPGGKGANQAAAAARWKAATKLLAFLGRDAFGEQLSAALREAGIDLSLVEVIEGAPTGLAWIEVDLRGRNRITVVPGANALLGVREARAKLALLTAEDLLLAQLEIPLPTAEAGFALAKAKGAITLLNASPLAPLSEGLLRSTDYLLANREEFSALSGISRFPEDLAEGTRNLRKKGVQNLVITAGASGAFLCLGDRTPIRVPAPSLRAIDTTGAGDIFAGVLAAGLLRDGSVVAAATTAVAAASLSCTRPGTLSSIPEPEEVSALLGSKSSSRSRSNTR